MINKNKLLSKGWTEEEIQHAESILAQAPHQRSEKIRTLDKIIFFGALFLVLVGNFVMTVVLIPFMLFANPIYLYPTMMFLGIVIGALFDLIILDIEKTEHIDVFKPGPFLFAVSLINIFIITKLSNQLAQQLNWERGIHYTLLVSAVYVIGFMAPYLYTRKYRKKLLEA